jgi:hypothetical protein
MSVVTGYGLNSLGIGVQFLAGKEIFLFSTVSKPLKPTQPHIQGAPKIRSCGVKVILHLHLILRLRICGSVPPLLLYHHGGCFIN